MEALDRDMVQACKYAAKKCRRKARDPWSTLLATTCRQIKAAKRTLGLYRIRRRLGLNHSEILTDEEFHDLKQQLRDLQKQLRSIVERAREIRHEELEKKAYLLALEGNTVPAKIIRQLIRAENIKRVFFKLRFIRGLFEQKQLSNIEVPEDPGDDPKTCKVWRTVATPKEIEEILIERNKSHFNQASGTPFTVEPLRQQLNYTASTITSELILNGEYTNDDLDLVTQHLLSYLRRCPDVPLLTNSISRDQFIGKLKSWDESTSTSPSGVHLGHYMSLIKPHSLSKDDPRLPEFEQNRSHLVDFHVDHLNYAMKHGTPVDRWSHIVTCMIRKDADNSKIHRLRVIHLYEADYNLLLGVKWRELLHSCEDNKVLNDSHYGGRKGRSGHEPVWMEELEMEITRCCRRSLIKFDNDATSCYDRIVLAFAALIHRKYGMHPDVIKLHGTNLGKAQYFIKTSIGVSEVSYRNCEESEVHGTGQGSTNSPAIWLVISSTLFDCHNDKAHGATFISPDRSRKVHFSMVGFVDDSTGRCNKFQDDAVMTEELISMMTSDAQLWQDLLWNSGGDLELSKCGFSLIAYKFKKNGTPELIEFKDLFIWLTKPDGTKYKIPCVPPDKAHRTLGYWKSPDGSQSAHLHQLLEKSTDLGLVASRSSLNRFEAWTYYSAIYIPSLSYALPASHFSEDELMRVQRKALPGILSKCGYARSTHRTIIFTPVPLGGAGFYSLYSLQGIGQCQLVFKFWNSSGQIHELLHVALFWAQAMSGMSQGILTDVWTTLPHLDSASHWFSNLRQYLCKLNSYFHLVGSPTILLEREHDAHIMDLVVQCKVFSAYEIRMINYCRLYLQCFTVSDLCTANGREVDRHMLAGRLHPDSSRSKWIHFIQAKPCPASWTLWRRANRLWCDQRGKLLQPLGRWLLPQHQSRRIWPHYHQTNSRCIVQLFEVHPSSTSIPDDVIPVDIKTKTFGRPYVPIPLPCVESFDQYVLTLPPWERLLLQHVHYTYGFDRQTAIAEISTSTCVCAGDGSAANGLGTYGWIIAKLDGTRIVAGSGYVYGYKPSSFRAETWAQLALLCFTVHSCSFFHKPPPQITTYSDSESLVKTLPNILQKPYFVPNDCLQPDWDCLSQLQQHIRDKCPSFELKWVKGHQDRSRPYDTLPLEAQLNVDCDRLATAHYSFAVPPDIHISPAFSTSPACLVTPEGSVTSHFKQRLLQAEWKPKIRAYIASRHNWPIDLINIVNWEALSASMRKHYHRRLFYVKLLHGIAPCGKIAHRYDTHSPHVCPLCSAPQEDWIHMLQCPHPSRQVWRLGFLSRLRRHTTKLNTPPEVEMMFVTGITNCLCNTTEVYQCSLSSVSEQQSSLGWSSIFQGLFSTGWQAATSTSSPSWTSEVIDFIWCELWELWLERNEDRHGTDTASRELASKIKLRSQLEALYEYRQKVFAKDRNLFRENVEIHLEERVPAIRQWIMSHAKAIIVSAREAQREDLRGVLPLTVYFPRRHHPSGD